MNLGQIRSKVKTYLMNNSTDTASLTWSDSELNDYVNEGVFYIQQLTESVIASRNIAIVAGQPTYDLPVEDYQLIRTTFDRVNTPQTNEYELDRDNPAWRSDPQGQPRRFYMPQFNQAAPWPVPVANGTTYEFNEELGTWIETTEDDGVTADVTNWGATSEVGTTIGLTDTAGPIIQILVDPQAPAGQSPDLGIVIEYNTDEGNLGVIYVTQPYLLVNDTDEPSLQAYFHEALVQYAVMRAFARDGEYQDVNLAQAWFQAFSDWMESAMLTRRKNWPTHMKVLEPYGTGNVFKERLQSVGVPGILQRFGAA